MNETQQAESTIKQFLPGDVTPEEIEMMAWLQGLMRKQGEPNGAGSL